MVYLLGIHIVIQCSAGLFVRFMAEEVRQTVVQALQNGDFFSVCMDSSTDKAIIDEEMVQVRYLENNLPIYRSVFYNFKDYCRTSTFLMTYVMICHCN